jgi:FG-GAP repeat
MRRSAVVLLMILAVGAAPGVNGPTDDSGAAADLAAESLRADFNNDGFADLAVGTPYEDAGSIEDAGTVNVLYSGAGGLTGSGSQTLTQNTSGVGSTAEARPARQSRTTRPGRLARSPVRHRYRPARRCHV